MYIERQNAILSNMASDNLYMHTYLFFTFVLSVLNTSTW